MCILNSSKALEAMWKRKYPWIEKNKNIKAQNRRKTHVISRKRPHGKGKYQNMNKTEIGIKRGNSYQKN